MDKYVEIQKIFSDFYFHEFLPSIKAENGNSVGITMGCFIKFYAVALFITVLPFIPINNLQLPFWVGLPLVLLFILSTLFLPLLVIFSAFLTIQLVWVILHGDKYVDLGLKNKFYPKLFERLSFLHWKDGTEHVSEVLPILKKHKLFDVNLKFFKVDDIFWGWFNYTGFSVYEISNRYNILQILCYLISLFFVPGSISYVCAKLLMLYKPDISMWHYVCLVVLIFIALSGFIAIVMRQKEFSFNFLDNKFRGVVAVFDLQKNIQGHTLIFENHYDNALVSKILANGYEKVSFEDEEFNKRYSVYTTNQVEARYALTTAMMERLKNLHHHFKSKYIRASFKDDKLVIAIQADKDLFRLASAWKEIYSKDYQTMFLELISILKITDALNLQNDTGL